jgi:Protein of unknown function (DUF4236)
MGFSFRKSKKIAPGLRLNVSKSGLGLSAGVRGARVSKNTKGETHVSAGRGGLYFRKRLKEGGGAEEGLTPEQEEQARNLEFGAYLVEKAQGQGLTGPGDVISDELIEEAAEEFFGDTDSPEARAAIAYVNDAG